MILSGFSFHLYYQTHTKHHVYIGASYLVFMIVSGILISFILLKSSFNFDSQLYLLTAISVLFPIGLSKLLSDREKENSRSLIIFLSVIAVTPFLPSILGRMVLSISLISYGIYNLIVHMREASFNDWIKVLIHILIGVFGLIGFIFANYGACFLFSLCLFVLLAFEIHLSFKLITRKMMSAGIQSIKDKLTGLYNKDFLYKKARQLAKNHEISIIFSDIDNFKNLNDTKGHDYGDKVLKQISGILKEVVQNNGYACRFGGEELVAIVLKGDPVELAETYRKRVEEQGFSVSVGVASGSDDGDELIKFADEYMYLAKKNGKNRIVYNKNWV